MNVMFASAFNIDTSKFVLISLHDPMLGFMIVFLDVKCPLKEQLNAITLNWAFGSLAYTWQFLSTSALLPAKGRQ